MSPSMAQKRGQDAATAWTGHGRAACKQQDGRDGGDERKKEEKDEGGEANARDTDRTKQKVGTKGKGVSERRLPSWFPVSGQSGRGAADRAFYVRMRCHIQSQTSITYKFLHVRPRLVWSMYSSWMRPCLRLQQQSFL